MVDKRNRHSQGVVAHACATLFAIFSFFFVVSYQSPLLEAFYDHVSTGKLDYSPFVMGLFVTALLLSLALWLNRYARFRKEWAALAYLPSTLLLAFLTDIDRSIYVGGWNCWGWVGVLLCGFAVYSGMAFLLRKLPGMVKGSVYAKNPFRVVWRNLLIFTLLFVLAGTLSNGEGNFKREALAVSLYKEGDCEGALEVGYKSLDASQELTAIRSFILVGNGLLGEKLFEYPQLYGSAGLLPALEQTSPLVPDTVFSFIGAKPGAGESVSEFLERVAHSDTVPQTINDLYLSSLLLDRHLHLFRNEVERVYGDVPADSLPKHYREALVLYSATDSCTLPMLESDTLYAEFRRLREIESQHADILVRSNSVRKQFGRTYWWYFLYGK